MRKPYNIDLTLIAPCPEELEDRDTMPRRDTDVSPAGWFALVSTALVGLGLMMTILRVW